MEYKFLYPLMAKGIPRYLEYTFALDNLIFGNILDIGVSDSSFYKQLLLNHKTITVLDRLYLEKQKNKIADKETEKNLDLIKGDIRFFHIGHKNKYNNILMISTLEHIGLPNFIIKNEDAITSEQLFITQLKVLKNCTKLLRRKGRIIITVPFGRSIDYPNFQLFYNKENINRISEHYNIVKEEYLTAIIEIRKENKITYRKKHWYKCRGRKECQIFPAVNAKPETKVGVVCLALEPKN